VAVRNGVVNAEKTFLGGGMKPFTLLAVDDKRDNLFVLEAVVTENFPDGKVITALSAEEGLAMAEEAAVDGILLDVQMPDMSGIEMCGRLKANPDTAHIPILLITAHRTTAEVRARALDAGAYDFIAKPVDTIELSAKIRVMLRTRWAEDDLRELSARLAESVTEKSFQADRSEEKYRNLFEFANDGIFIVDPDTRQFLDANRVAAESLGYTRDEFLRISLGDIHRFEDADANHDIVGTVLEKGSLVFEAVHLRKDGSEMPVEGSAKVINYDGQKAILCFVRDISARRQAEELLRKSEERYRDLFIQTEAVQLLSDPADGAIVDANLAAAAYYNLPVEELRQRKISDIIAPESADVADASESADESHRKHVVARHRLPSGDIRDVEVYSSPITLDGRPLRVSIVHDITERVRAEMALHGNEKRYRELSQNMGTCVAILHAIDDGRDFEFTEFNRAAEKAERISADKVIGRRLTEVFPAIRESGFFDAFERVWRSGEAERLPIAQYRDNRISGWRSYYVYKLHTGEIVALYDDVTDRKRSEDAVITANRALRTLCSCDEALVHSGSESELLSEVCRLIVEVGGYHTAWVGFANDDPDGQVLPVASHGCDPRILEGLNISLHDDAQGPSAAATAIRTGKLYLVRNILENDDYRHWHDFVGENGFSSILALPLVEGEKGFGSLTVWADEPKAFDGNEIDMLIGLADNLAFGILAFRDIEEHKRTEEKLRQSQKMEAVGQLTGGIAHDFNNILAVILGNLEFLDEEMPDNELTKKLVISAVKAVRRGADLTEQLLAFSRKQHMVPELLNPNKVVSSMQDLLGRTLGETITVEAQCQEDAWPIMTDRSQLENAILNLSVNGRDSMPEGGRLLITTENVTVDEASRTEHGELDAGRYLALSVTDSGTGMSPEVIEHAFEPFFTTKAMGAGTGLGLSMVYGFARQSGGVATIVSEPGKGTTIRLYLAVPPDVTANPAEENAAPEGQVGGTETILLVEDDSGVRQIAVNKLTRLGYTVFEAADGPAAQRVLEKESGIDLLFTDVIMPGGMTGVDLAREVRRRYKGIKVLFTSGYAADHLGKDRLLQADARIIAKPYSNDQLAAMVREVLDT
jgi:PAS domain S-box-containing protein